MTSALDKALSDNRALINTAHTTALRLKMAGIDITAGADGGFFSAFSDQGANRQRYGLFRGWVYAAINALAMEAAGQPCLVGTLSGAEPNPSEDEEERRIRIGYTKRRRPKMKRIQNVGHRVVKMPSSAFNKVVGAEMELEIIPDHPLRDAIEHPNPIQTRWQFVYSFVANLCLTGWSYIIAGEVEGQLQFYALPTTWVTPVHDKGPFSQFKITNPKNPAGGQDEKLFDREQVAFAHLPNPSDPLSALAPAAAQALSIRIDDHIQTSQEAFFENGIFPSMIVTVGKIPHPDVPGGFRPRLEGEQLRQVLSAVRRVTGGVANYGNPAVVDGLIESFQRMSATQNEMGWEKSEDRVIDRILSAYGVHRFILGSDVKVGGYAQTYSIESRFCKKVNTYLDMLGCVMTNFGGPMTDTENRTVVWWEKCEAEDPSITSREYVEGRKNNDVTRNEYRAKLGLPPMEEEIAEKNKLLEAVGGLTGFVQMLKEMGAGNVTEDQAVFVAGKFFELDEEEVRAGIHVEEEEDDEVVDVDVTDPTNPTGEEDETDDELNEEIVEELQHLVEALKAPITINLEGVEFSREVQADNRPLLEAIRAMGRQTEQLEQSAGSSHKEELDKVAEALQEATRAIQAKTTDDTIKRLQQPIHIKQSDINLKQPEITVEVLPTPVTVEVGPTPVTVNNTVDPTPVEVTNQVGVPAVEVINNVPEAAVNVEVKAPDVTVQAPNVEVKPEINVEPGKVDVNINKDKPKRAQITHPDGTISQVQLEE